MNFKKITLITAAILLIATSAFSAQVDSVLFSAMQDELGRNMSSLVMENLGKPYFISYTIDDYQSLSIEGVLGSLTRSNIDRGRYLTVDLRVGSSKLDNSNFVAGFFGSNQNYFSIPFENDYDAVRNKIYLATDELYKQALKTLSQKQAYLQTRIVNDRPDDFIMPTPNKYIGQSQAFDLEKAKFEELVLAASEVFTKYPEIISSRINFVASINNEYLVNSVGSQMLRGDRCYTISLNMSAKSAEGDDIDGSDRLTYLSASGLPSKVELVKWAQTNAEQMKARIAGVTLDDYTGPVLMTGDAASEFFRQLLVKNVSSCPAPTYERDEMAQRFPGPALANKVKRRVLPESFNVFDDPTIDTYKGFKLIGHFAVDDAGDPSKRVQLVENGKLVNLLIGLAPTKLVKEANGHARGAVSKDVEARPGNVIIESTSKATLADLKKSMIDMCKDMGLDYGIVITQLGNPNSQGGGFFSLSGGETALASPLGAYKLYPDGREEALRSLEFNDVNIRILKDIIQAGDDAHCYNYLIGDDTEMPVSLVCPSVLVEEMELKKSESKVEKPPVLPSPLAKKIE
jgi:TldD protein